MINFAHDSQWGWVVIHFVSVLSNEFHVVNEYSFTTRTQDCLAHYKSIVLPHVCCSFLHAWSKLQMKIMKQNLFVIVITSPKVCTYSRRCFKEQSLYNKHNWAHTNFTNEITFVTCQPSDVNVSVLSYLWRVCFLSSVQIKMTNSEESQRERFD